MVSLLSHPAVQSGIIPFLVALPVILFLGITWPRFIGLAVIAAFTVTVGMVTGFSLTPITSTKKILLMTYCAAILGLFLDACGSRWTAYRHYFHGVFSVLAVLGFLWVIWPAVSREGSQYSAAMLIGLCAYVFWIVIGISLAFKRPEQVSIAVFALAVGTAIVCIVGATALYGQLAAPFAAATGAWLLVFLFSNRLDTFPMGFYLPATLICAVLGASATVYASLDWGSLAIFALIPPLIQIPFKSSGANWLKLMKTAVTSLIPVLAAVWYTVRQSIENGY